jgi:hypothetical protein
VETSPNFFVTDINSLTHEDRQDVTVIWYYELIGMPARFHIPIGVKCAATLRAHVEQTE